MCRDVLKVTLIFLTLVQNSVEREYEYVLEDENIVSECHQKPPGYSGINKLFDLSNASFAMVEGGIAVTGYVTTVWDNQATDTIQVSSSVTYFDRGYWQPTVINLKYTDFCSTWLEEKSLFYQFSKHLLNYDEAKHNCLNVAGTKLSWDPFVISLTFGVDLPLRPGRYRTTYLLSATDHLGQPRPEKICFEVNGSFEIL